ncbi:DUF4876 domain-containing protein [uncultured Draconibacterium sp.]|uniref:DUF4876 domain-containing protein n=1 Tax=uncultured Draconibacterium sp. TaxID=1573823 RepID=UPI0032162D7A
MSIKIKFYLLVLIGFVIVGLQSCKNDFDNLYQTNTVTIQLNYPDDFEVAENVTITLINYNSNITYTEITNANGIATFEIPYGIYNAAVSELRTVSGTAYIFTGNTSLTVTETDKNSDVTTINLSASKANNIIIKELYNGGCQKDDGSGTFYRGQYVILYNNSVVTTSLDNFCFGAAYPYNSQGSNYFYSNGSLSYETEGWIPAAQGIWYFPEGISLEPGEQIVVALNCAINNTLTYSQSINFANANYCTLYDIDVYSNESHYPAPSSLIPTSHYLSAVKYGIGNAWSCSYTSPAFYIFATQEVTPAEFATNVENYGNYGGSATQVYAKVPIDWVIDGIEVFKQGDDNQQRLTSAIDAGYVYLNNKNGYTLYRNVNQEATEALAENAGKLIYNYSGGTTDLVDGSTDPSGIDAEASIANGARIIYSDTNSSTNDFHQRKKASLRD